MINASLLSYIFTKNNIGYTNKVPNSKGSYCKTVGDGKIIGYNVDGDDVILHVKVKIALKDKKRFFVGNNVGIIGGTNDGVAKLYTPGITSTSKKENSQLVQQKKYGICLKKNKQE